MPRRQDSRKTNFQNFVLYLSQRLCAMVWEDMERAEQVI